MASAMEAYLALAPYGDVRAALGGLSQYRLGILSNGCPRMLDPMIDRADLRGAFAAVMSVDSVRIYKPSPRVYALATDAFNLPAQAIGFVSSNYWDICGAAAFGFTTFWLNRSGNVADRLPFEPRATITELSQLAAAVGRVT
jgi:2-haloacid dehalogenase